MTLKFDKKYLKFVFVTITLLIITSLTMINQIYFKKNRIEQKLSDFKNETKNIHSIFIKKLKNNYEKRKSTK